MASVFQVISGRSHIRQHVEHAAVHASWRYDHDADLGWAEDASMTMTVGGPTPSARSSIEEESLLSILDCYEDRSLYHSLRAQLQVERDLAN